MEPPVKISHDRETGIQVDTYLLHYYDKALANFNILITVYRFRSSSRS